MDGEGRTRGPVPFGKSHGCWCGLALSQLCAGRLCRLCWRGRWGCAGALLQPMLWVLVLRRSLSPCCWGWALQGHTSHLPQHRGGHVAHSCHCPRRCGRGCSTAVDHLLSLCPEPCILNLLRAWCSKRAVLSRGQRLKAPLDLLFPFPSGAFLPIRCLLLVWEELASWRCGWWADEKGRLNPWSKIFGIRCNFCIIVLFAWYCAG